MMVSKFAWRCFAISTCMGGLVLPGFLLGQTASPKKKSSPEAIALYSDAANLHNNDEYDLALEHWSSFLQRYPADPLASRVLYYKGVCHVRLNQLESAAESLKRAIDEGLEPDLREEAYLQLGWSQFSRGQLGHAALLKDAADTLQAMLDKYPSSKLMDQALFYLAESNYHQGKKSDAIKSYSRLVNDHADSKLRADALYALGVSYQETEQHQQAAQVFGTFLTELPNHELSTEVLMRKAETLVQMDKLADAEQLFATVASTGDFSSADYACLRQAYCRALQGQHEAAAQLYAQIPSQFPDSTHVAEATMAAARSYYSAQKLDEATHWFRHVLREEHANASEAAHWLCRILLKRSQPVKATELARRVLEKTPEDDAYFVDLKMDHADGLYEQPEHRRQAVQMYQAINAEHQNHRLAAQALYNAAYGAMDVQQYDESMKLAQQFLVHFPDDRLVPDTMYIQAECHLLQARYNQAEDAFKQLLNEHAEHPDAKTWRLRLATARYLQRKYEETIDVLSKAVDGFQSPAELAEAYFLLGVSHRQLERNEDAVRLLRESLRADNQWSQADEVLLNLSRALQQLGQLDQAKSGLRDLVSQFPDSSLIPRAHYQLAECSYAAGEFDEAATSYRTVSDNWPDSELTPHALYGQGWAWIRQNEFERAATNFDKLLTVHGNHKLASQAHNARALCRKRTGDFRGCIEDVNAYLQSDPPPTEKANALYLRGLAESGLKQNDAALITFKTILREVSDFQRMDKVLYEIAWTFKNIGDGDSAVEHFRQLAHRFGDSPLAAEAYFHVGEDAYAKQDHASAAESFSQVLQVDPTDDLAEKALYKLGWANFQMGQYARATKAFGRQIESYQEGSLIHDGRFMHGESLFKQEKYAQALASLADVDTAKVSSENIRVLTRLRAAQSSAQLENWDESLSWLAPILELHASSRFAVEAMYEKGWALQNLGRLAEAGECYHKVAEQSRGVIGARARFMLGELHFTNKDFAQAVRQFRLLVYGYGGQRASNDVKVWQAKGGLEAGRCMAVLAGQATDKQKQATQRQGAIKYFRYVIQSFRGTEEAMAAAEQLKKLGA